MKGISGIISGVVEIVLLLLVVSLTLAAMNYAYGAQQIEANTIMSQISQPHVAQVSPDSVMTSGRLLASYIIYPNGRVTPLNETVSGIRGFQSYLDGNPWAIVVFSNGQWVNVTNVQIPGSGYGILGTGLVPYYPDPINPQNATQLAQLLQDGLRYNVPITINNTLMYSYGRILAVPITSDSGWLNFTVTYLGPDSNGGCFSFVVLVPNITGNVVAIYVVASSEFEGFMGFREGQSPVFSWLCCVISGYDYYWVPVYRAQLTYGIYQFDGPSNYYEPFFGDFMNLTYYFSTTITSLSPIEDLRVAIKFSPGQPAQMYIWVYNGSWYRVLLPSIEAPVGSGVGGTGPSFYPKFQYYSSVATWLYVVNTSPVNIYSEYVNEVETWNLIYGWLTYYDVYVEPITLYLGSDILVVPYYQGTAIFNATYSI